MLLQLLQSTRARVANTIISKDGMLLQQLEIPDSIECSMLPVSLNRLPHMSMSKPTTLHS
jgi:hypothetical protein